MGDSRRRVERRIVSLGFKYSQQDMRVDERSIEELSIYGSTYLEYCTVRSQELALVTLLLAIDSFNERCISRLLSGPRESAIPTSALRLR